MFNILVPISKFDIEGKFPYPHNLIEINDKPLIEWVHDSLKVLDGRFIFVISNIEEEIFSTSKILKIISPNCNVIVTNGPTAGAAATCLLATDLIDNEDELVIVAGDQLINNKLNESINHFRSRNLDGGILVFKSVHPKWSYVLTSSNDKVTLVQEKQVISNKATAGFYYYKSGKEFVKAAKQMILKRDSLNNYYYVSHTYNQMILSQLNIGTFEISKQDYLKLSTPEEIERFIQQKES
jgi:dTDP-glucose pyrophosphorylase